MDINYLLLLQELREKTGGVMGGVFGFITKLGESSVVLFVLALIYWSVEKREGASRRARAVCGAHAACVQAHRPPDGRGKESLRAAKRFAGTYGCNKRRT